MQLRTEIVKGKRRIVIIRKASGKDNVKEAILAVMGPDFYFDDMTTTANKLKEELKF